MNTQNVLIYEVDVAKRHAAEKLVTKVLADYAQGLLAAVDSKQRKVLEEKGYRLKLQKDSTLIKLRSVELDTSLAPPQPPESLKMRSLKNVSGTAKKYWLIQFIGPVKPDWSEEIALAGAAFGDYIPENAFLAEMSEDVAAIVKTKLFVQWIGPYEPVYKVSLQLMGRKKKIPSSELKTLAIATDTILPSPLGNIVVILHRPGEMKNVLNAIKKLGGKIISQGKARIRVDLDPSFISEIAAINGVKWIEPVVIPKLFNNVAEDIVGVRHVWDNHGLDGSGEIVAVADTGIDTGLNDNSLHQDIRGRLVNIFSWSIPGGLHPLFDNTSWDDGAADLDSGHGTHVAGSVLGSGLASGGTTRGMAFNASLVFQAVEQWADWKSVYNNPPYNMSDGYYLLGIPDDLRDLFRQAYDSGARIHTNSWGGNTDSSGNDIFSQYTEDSAAIDEFIWQHKDMCILFAAGNSGVDNNSNGVIDLDSLSVQSVAKNCITVGASENNRPHGSSPAPGYDLTYAAFGYPANPVRNDHVSDNPDGMAAFSSRGPADDERIKPDVVAPGTNILSVRSSVAASTGWGLLPVADPGRPFYMYMGGTSMATPLTAGTTALIRQYLRNVCLHAAPSAALLKAVLLHGAVSMTGQYAPPEVGAAPDNNQGWGRVNLEQSLFPAYPLFWKFYDNPAEAVGTSEQRDYSVVIANTGVPLRVTLVWSDYPGNPASAGLVNQLELSLVAPDGTIVQGGPTDNNVQQVVIGTPQAGTYTLRVLGLNVPTVALEGSRQDFALVYSGGVDFVDVYIKDNPADQGVPPSVGTLYQSPDIWVSLSNDPSLPPAENPEYGQTNYVFVRIHNRGPKSAVDAVVSLYWAHAGTNLSRPYWNTTGISVDGSPGNVRQITVPGHSGIGDGEMVTEAFEWTPPDPDDFAVDPAHFCLFATVDHPEDPILQEDVGVVGWEDNLAWKNVLIQDTLPDIGMSSEFYVAGDVGHSVTANLLIDGSSLPQGGSVSIRVPARWLRSMEMRNVEQILKTERGRYRRLRVTGSLTGSIRGIKLLPGENTLVRLEVVLPESAQHGEIFPVYCDQWVNGQHRGRVNVLARMAGTPAYIGNRNSLELHVADCKWAAKMNQKNKMPFNDLELAIRRGFNGCRFCLPEKDRG